jgi:hypothetical protein
LKQQREIDKAKKKKREFAALIVKLEQLRRLRVKRRLAEGRPVKDVDYIEEILRKAEELKKHTQISDVSTSQSHLTTESRPTDEKKNEEVATNIQVDNTSKATGEEEENAEPPENVYYQAFKSIDNMIAIRSVKFLLTDLIGFVRVRKSQRMKSNRSGSLFEYSKRM